MINLDPLKAKKNQKILKIVIVGAVVMLAIGFSVLTDDSDKKNQTTLQENKIKRTSLINEEDMIKSKWIGDVSTDLDIANEHYRGAVAENSLLKKELNDIKTMIRNIKNGEPDNKNLNSYQPTEKEYKGIVNNNLNNNPRTENSFFNDFPRPYEDRNSDFMKPKEKKVITFNPMENSLNVVELKKKDNDSEESREKKEDEEYLSTGSITKVMILSGFDAPTMSQAKTNPLPILMKVMDMSILPNRRKYDLKECFVMGEGYGDLSSERVYIRTNNISCLTSSGKHIDMPFKGMVSGEDGKVGLRGKVVTKQGSLLAKTLIAGFLEGVGRSFQQSQQFTMMGGAGVTTGIREMSPQESLKFGALGGGSKAAEKLADFYLKMADQVSPVIEISAGREVDLISTSLTKFETLEEMKKNEE